MFLNICSGSTCSSVTLAHRSANTTAPCDFPSLVTRAPIIHHFTSDTRPRPPLHTEPRAKDPLPLQEDHYNVITITIIINYNYFCPPEAVKHCIGHVHHASAPALLLLCRADPAPASSFNKMLSESNIVILLIECNLWHRKIYVYNISCSEKVMISGKFHLLFGKKFRETEGKKRVNWGRSLKGHLKIIDCRLSIYFA